MDKKLKRIVLEAVPAEEMIKQAKDIGTEIGQFIFDAILHLRSQNADKQVMYYDAFNYPLVYVKDCKEGTASVEVLMDNPYLAIIVEDYSYVISLPRLFLEYFTHEKKLEHLYSQFDVDRLPEVIQVFPTKQLVYNQGTIADILSWCSSPKLIQVLEEVFGSGAVKLAQRYIEAIEAHNEQTAERIKKRWEAEASPILVSFVEVDEDE